MGIEFAKEKSEFLTGLATFDQSKDWMKKNIPFTGLVIAGRSNVGKSSLINNLLGDKIARVSKTPGRTTEINIFKFELINKGRIEKTNNLFLFDLPGYGFAKVSDDQTQKWQELMSEFFSSLPKTTLVVIIQDARHPSMTSDVDFLYFIEQFGLESAVVLNKADKLKNQKEKNALKKLIPAISKKFKQAKTFNIVSVEKGDGMKEFKDNLVNFIIKSQ